MMKNALFAILLGFGTLVFAQNSVDLSTVEPGRFDQGKMWTFENPPVEYFKEAYGFDVTEEWMADVRKSSLRFASWCSASFISENGLILTNHHCSRGVTASVMKEGENFDENGFYAETLADERRVEDLFVDQMVMVADITQEVKESEKPADEALEEIKAKYAEMEGWSGLKLETRTYYSGGMFSLYGYKTYNDIRLVLYPETALGYFGGDPDNFTYPRYNLDFTLWRAYDENGEPLKPANYFSFKPEGAAEDEAVFVIGNPGSTGRYLTIAQLHYMRDTQIPAMLSFLRNRMEIFFKAAEMEEDVYVKDSIQNLGLRFSNSNKAYTGRLDGMMDPILMTKKEIKEQELRSNVSVEGDDPWEKLEENAHTMSQVYPEVLLLSKSGTRGKINAIIHELAMYGRALDADEEEKVTSSKMKIDELLKDMDPNLERILFVTLLTELQEHSKGNYVAQVLGESTPYDFTTDLLENSILLNTPDKFYKLKSAKLEKEPLMVIADHFVPAYEEATALFRQANSSNSEYQEKIMNMQFQLSGASSPPDATFSLRLADGVVKGYEYNGTVAPVKTTYFGLYDRYYSNDGEFPWNLPERWMDPPAELLKAPMNFVCTADIIGGNSGSPVINTNKEVVGLVFDGNIESLPGYFIFDDTLNRTVSVHAGGIAAAVKYIYKADRLLSELNVE